MYAVCASATAMPLQRRGAAFNGWTGQGERSESFAIGTRRAIRRSAAKADGVGSSRSELGRCLRSFFVNLPRLYSNRRGNPAMAINGRRNKPIGPGGSTRRLHQSAHHVGGFWRGRTRIDEGVKGALLPGMVPALSGQNHSCKRQLCSGCSGCVTQLEIPN